MEAKNMVGVLGLFVVFGAMFLQCTTAQTVHVVGSEMCWDVPQGGADAYATWAATRQFVVGDILLFNFTTNDHDVVEVPKSSFDSCNGANPIGSVITTGPANITLVSPGQKYYICTIGTHCQRGQKLAITVSLVNGGASPPSTTPVPPTATPTMPSPASGTPAECPPEPASSPSALIGPPAATTSPVSSGYVVDARFLLPIVSIVMALFV